MRASWLLVLVGLVSCAPPPRPAVFAEVDRTRVTAAAKESSALAPQAFLAAEQLRRDAIRAYDDRDRAGSEIIAEEALAAYTHASVLARLAKADDRVTATTARIAVSGQDVAALEEKQRRVAAEADDIELRFRVTRDALPVASSEPGTADREASRLASARALSLEARLLCVATQMLGPDTPGVTAAFQGLDQLDAEVQKKPTRAPLDAAVRLRAACLSELTGARRATATNAPESGATDALLEELGRAGFEPRRDDRGVSAILREAFQGTSIMPAARERLTALGQVGHAHPAFPVLIVVHAARGSTTPRDAARADAAAKVLTEAGAPHVQAKTAGDALPVVQPGRADAALRNERLEIVFVAPSP
jgi:hypothetical protein